jgi:putative intracellular protease/amidase
MKIMTLVGMIGLLCGICFGADANNAPAQPGRASMVMRITLPDPNSQSSMALDDVIGQYVPVQSFMARTLGDDQIGQILWAGNMTMRALGRFRNTAEQAGQFAFELYLCSPTGVYRYDPLAHAIDRLVTTDARLGLSNAAGKTAWVKDAGFDIIIVPVRGAFRGSRTRNGELIQAGQVAQTMAMEAFGMGLGTAMTTTFDISLVRKFVKLGSDQDPLLIVGVGAPATPFNTTAATKTQPQQKSGGRALFIIPSKNFDDRSLFNTMDVLIAGGINCQTASSQTGSRPGMMQGRANATIAWSDVDVTAYDAVIFIGGQAMDYYSNKTVLALAKAAADSGKVVAAIGEAPLILAKAGVLSAARARPYLTGKMYRVNPGQSVANTGIETESGIITAPSADQATLVARAVILAIQSSTHTQPSAEQ